MFRFTPSVQEKVLCLQFAKAVLETVATVYASRNQSYAPAIIEQNRYGKLAELAAKAFLNSYGFTTSPVDFNIYQGKDKSHDADLFANGNEFAVKSCKKHPTFETSWVFDYCYIRNIISKKITTPEILLLTEVLPNDEIRIVGMVRLSEVLHRLKNPRADKFFMVKKVLYMSDLMPEDFIQPEDLFTSHKAS
jgi:hypothetical protein